MQSNLFFTFVLHGNVAISYMCKFYETAKGINFSLALFAVKG